MVMNVDPRQLVELQKTTQHINGVIKVDYKARTITISLSSSIPEVGPVILQLLDQFADSLAQQFSAYFAIKGEIVEVNKPR